MEIYISEPDNYGYIISLVIFTLVAVVFIVLLYYLFPRRDHINIVKKISEEQQGTPAKKQPSFLYPLIYTFVLFLVLGGCFFMAFYNFLFEEATSIKVNQEKKQIQLNYRCPRLCKQISFSNITNLKLEHLSGRRKHKVFIVIETKKNGVFKTAPTPDVQRTEKIKNDFMQLKKIINTPVEKHQLPNSKN